MDYYSTVCLCWSYSCLRVQQALHAFAQRINSVFTICLVILLQNECTDAIDLTVGPTVSVDVSIAFAQLAHILFLQEAKH